MLLLVVVYWPCLTLRMWFLQQLLMLEATLLFGGMGLHDQHSDLRLDVDNMSYEVRHLCTCFVFNLLTGPIFYFDQGAWSFQRFSERFLYWRTLAHWRVDWHDWEYGCVCAGAAGFGGKNRQCEHRSVVWSDGSEVEENTLFFAWRSGGTVFTRVWHKVQHLPGTSHFRLIMWESLSSESYFFWYAAM
jgi:hypothetical protein